jgi:peptidoglycan hydrolase-like protein with peptidoglycan-binding domain
VTDLKPFFPKYLNKGAEHPAMLILQVALIAAGFNSKNIKLTGVNDEATAKGIEILQTYLGVEADGNFGPDTREAWVKRGGPDVNALTEESILRKAA